MGLNEHHPGLLAAAVATKRPPGRGLRRHPGARERRRSGRTSPDRCGDCSLRVVSPHPGGGRLPRHLVRATDARAGDLPCDLATCRQSGWCSPVNPHPPGTLRRHDLLQQAVSGLDVSVRVAGQRQSSGSNPLLTVSAVTREEFMSMLRHWRTLVLPLQESRWSLGQPTCLNAMGLGKVAVVTDGRGVPRPHCVRRDRCGCGADRGGAEDCRARPALSRPSRAPRADGASFAGGGARPLHRGTSRAAAACGRDPTPPTGATGRRRITIDGPARWGIPRSCGVRRIPGLEDRPAQLT